MCRYMFVVGFDLINNLSDKQGRVFLGWASTKLGKMCLAQGQQRSEASEAPTCSLGLESYVRI